jgi:predicted amidohydrolase YtcJ
LSAIASAVSRVSVDGYELALQEKIDATAALAMFTSAGAQLARLDAGVLAPGRLADLVVLPADPLELAPVDLIKTPVELTIIGGRVVYERVRALSSAGASIHSSPS